MSIEPETDGRTETFLGVPNSPPRLRRRSRSASLEERRGRRWSHGHSSSHSEHDDEVHDHWHTDQPHKHYGPKIRSWHQRPQSPGLKWHKKLTALIAKRGRVLVIDYVRHDLSKAGTRKVSTQEIHDIGTLRRLYTGKRRDEAVLRVFHVQNAEWAEQFFFKKFNIADRNDLVDSDFAKYVFWKHPERVRNRPLLSGKAWQTQHDPWRGISKTAFGLDYLKSYKIKDPEHQVETDPAGKFMELNCYDEATEDPRYGYDVYGQRVCVYIQHKERAPQPPPNFDGVTNPYEDTNGAKQRDKAYFPVLDTLDNGNAILIFENSKSESIEDTLIKARGQWESRWRRLPFYMAYDNQSSNDDDETAFLCARTIVSDIWRAVAQNWGQFLGKAGRHVEILEQKIYERPADESRADEIWRDSSHWLRCERLAYVHQNLLDEVGNNLRELSDDDPTSDDSTWLRSNQPDFQRITNLVQEDLVKPTASLSDLMYKSVGIRDTRHSLELSYSMWRLSWITFIFLPLTFTVGFFGMNVDIFSQDPPVYWFFVGSVPLMVIALALWYVLKWFLTASTRDPYSRGLYERLYHDLAVQYPTLWTRGGPARGTPAAAPRKERMKWYLVQRWNNPENTIKVRNQRTYNEDDIFDGLGLWSRVKRTLTRRWTAEISAVTTRHREIEKGGPATDHAIQEGIEVVQQSLNLSIPGAARKAGNLHLPNGAEKSKYCLPSNAKENAAEILAAAADAAEEGQNEPIPTELDQRISNLRPIGTPPRSSSGRPSSPGAASHGSGVMVEEREPEDDDEERRQSDDLAVNRFPGLRGA